MNSLVHKFSQYCNISDAEAFALEGLTQGRERHLHTREALVREGDKPRGVHVLLKGWACRCKTLQDGRRQIISVMLAGDLCDLHGSLLDHVDHSVEALTPITTAEVPQEAIDGVMASFPNIAKAFWWDALVREATQREWVLNLGQRTAAERLSHLFCELYFRQRVVGLTEALTCPMPITQTELGDATGLSYVHVNRTLQELRRENLILLKNNELTIINLRGLVSLAMFSPLYLHQDVGWSELGLV